MDRAVKPVTQGKKEYEFMENMCKTFEASSSPKTEFWAQFEFGNFKCNISAGSLIWLIYTFFKIGHYQPFNISRTFLVTIFAKVCP